MSAKIRSLRSHTYRFKNISKDKLEEDLVDYLKQIIALYTEKTTEDKTTIMYQCARPFETEEILFDIFYKELME